MTADTSVTGVFTLLLHGIDTLDWDTVRDCLAPELVTDYTSLWGGEAEKLTPDELLANWEPFATGFDATQHLTGPIVLVDQGHDQGDDTATGVTTVRGYHHVVPGQDGEPAGTWMAAGRYEVGFTRTADGWKVNAITLSMAYEDGSRDLVDLARARGERRSGGRFPA